MKWTVLWGQIPSQQKENQLNLGNLVRNLLAENNHFKCIYKNISNKSSTFSQPWTHYYQCNSSIIPFKVINYHDSPSYYTTWTFNLTFNLERILSQCQNQQEVLTYEWDPKMVIYSYKLGHYWWSLIATGILNRCTMISHGLRQCIPLGYPNDMWSRRLWS